MKLKNYILLSISTLTLAGCTSEDITNTPDDERLPLTFDVSLSCERPITRAAGSTIDAEDELLCYVRHVYNNASVQASPVTIKDGKPTTALYWDDFSNSSNATTDLRTDGHGLQSYYGYCYNGGAPTTALVYDTGVLGWTTNADQTPDGAMKANDLLWSAEQTAITYNHARDAHGTLSVPYSHAMSKFTIEIVAGEDFDADDLEATTVTLSGMNAEGIFTAPTLLVTPKATTTTVIMFRNAIHTSTTEDSRIYRTYEAVVVPVTDLSSNSLLASITNLDNNNYEIKMSDDIRSSWSSKLDENSKTKSGINYKLTVTVNKQRVTVAASLADWDPVTATGTGKIQFTADVADKGQNDISLKNGDSFALWRAKKVDDTTPVEADYGSTAVTYSYDGTSFSTLTPIYWPNKDDSYCFRALAEQTSNHTLLAVNDKTVAQGTDLFWGTSGTDAIAPRTGDVSMAFEHAMSKVIVTLKTETGDAEVDLKKATFELTNLSTSGTIALTDGNISAAPTVASAYSGLKSGDVKIMIPQTIDKDARLIINLHDGADDASSTTYSLQLNKCKDDKNAIIGKWLRGNQYNYTITITKEKMKFSATIKPWAESNVSGEASLDWD